MPIPVKRCDNVSSMDSIDFSALLNSFNTTLEQTDSSKLNIVASNRDADLLMDIWENSECKNDDLVIKPGYEVDNSDIIRLKTSGLLTGDSAQISLTKRGKKIITVMLLGEPNNFEKNRQTKKFNEILASINKRGKAGYRIPR